MTNAAMLYTHSLLSLKVPNVLFTTLSSFTIGQLIVEEQEFDSQS